MPAQGVDAAARPAHVAEQQLQHRRGSYDLRAKGMLRPSDSVNDRAGLLHVAVFANGSIEVSRFEELLLGNPGDALDHLRGVARIMLLQELEDATGILAR